jgi:hypothetical protein
MPLTPSADRWNIPVLVALLLIVATVGVGTLVFPSGPPHTITIGTIGVTFSPDGQGSAAPNGTATVNGTCPNSASWTTLGAQYGPAGPPYTTAMDVFCNFTFSDSSLGHSGPKNSTYFVSITTAEVSPPFEFVQLVPFASGCLPGGCHFTGFGLEFQLPNEGGTYNLEFTLLYTWYYAQPPT